MKKGKILTAIFSLLFVGMLGILFIISDADNQTEQNTKSFAATVSEIQVTNIGDGRYIDVFTEEHKTSLFISSELSKEIDISDLQKGEKIVFRIANKKASLFDQVAFIDIVSLESEHKTYISLSDYNAHTKSSIAPARIAATVLAVVFLSVAVYLFVKQSKK